uniref:Reverse transcriptase domain-containing protein n=1 Tax=Aegilops tauschii subsp. strangulata TaxID=200361 RepID=A0A453BTU3_AEGTS
MICKVQQNGLLTGLASDLVPNGVAVLQYADDTIICLEHDVEKALNLKLLLYMFELMSGLKVNFQKSEIMTIGGDTDIDSKYAEIFNCEIGHFPIKYLGMPVSFTTLKDSVWEFIVDKYLKCFGSWIGNAASSGGRLTLLTSVLSLLSLYHMSMWLMSKTFIERLDKHRRKFFWHGCNKKNRYYLVKWKRVCRLKGKGGLGVKDLRKQNISLMVKWWSKLETQIGVWQNLVRARYLQNKSVATVCQDPDSKSHRSSL